MAKFAHPVAYGKAAQAHAESTGTPKAAAAKLGATVTAQAKAAGAK